MQAGCGIRGRKIKGRWYVYVWSYEGPGRRHQVWTYAGPAGKARTSERALRLLLEREERAEAALERRIERCRAALVRVQGRA